MATVPYQGGVPEVAPETRVPDDFQHIQATPASFGGLIAEGEQRLGAGASAAGKFFGQVAADNATNEFVDRAGRILYGDPSKTTTGPDGTEQPDLGYMGLQGRAALDARPAVEKQLDDLMKSTKASLQTPEQELQFDRDSRRYRSMLGEKIGAYADAQSKAWYGEVNQKSTALAITHAVNNFDDPKEVLAARGDLLAAYTKQAQLKGGGAELLADARERADRDIAKVTIEATAVKDPVRAAKMADSYKDKLGPDYPALANHLRARAEQQEGIQAGDKLLGAAGKAAATGTALPTFAQKPGAAVTDPKALVGGFEGFRTQAYWDTNHYRVGYGSDTVTHADGTVAPVTAGTQITKADADRDLARRTQQTQAGIASQIGADRWAALDPATQASLTSVAYNYGHLPASMVQAAMSGDKERMALALVGLRDDNGGVNAARRTKEAANLLGFSVPGGATVIPFQGRAAVMPPQAQEAAPAPPIEVAAAAPAPTPSVSAPPGVIPPPPAPPPPAGPSPEEIRAKALTAALAAPIGPGGFSSEEARNHAVARIEHVAAAMAIAQEATTKAKKEANETAVNGYATRILKGENMDAIYDDITNDPHLTGESKMSLSRWLEQKGRRDESPGAMGPKFIDARKALLAPTGDPNRISSPEQVLEMRNRGDLTELGADKILKDLAVMRKDPQGEAVGLMHAQTAMLSYAKRHLSFNEEMSAAGVKLRDPKGEDLFETQFVPQFYSRLAQSKDPYAFLTKKNIDEMISGMRNPAQLARDRVAAQTEAVGALGGEAGATQAPAAPQGPVPAPPADVNPKGWDYVVKTPPTTATGKTWPYSNWAAQINWLRTNTTPEKIAAFDAKFAGLGLSAEQILERLKSDAAREAENRAEVERRSKIVEENMRMMRGERAPGAEAQR